MHTKSVFTIDIMYVDYIVQRLFSTKTSKVYFSESRETYMNTRTNSPRFPRFHHRNTLASSVASTLGVAAIFIHLMMTSTAYDCDTSDYR